MKVLGIRFCSVSAQAEELASSPTRGRHVAPHPSWGEPVFSGNKRPENLMKKSRKISYPFTALAMRLRLTRARPPAAALKSRRASRARRLRGLGLTVVGLLGLSCTLVRPRPPELLEGCRNTLRRGVFNAASLACFPELASPLEDLLCTTTFVTHLQLNRLGFGYGTSVLGQTLRDADYSVRAVEPLDPWAAQRWKQEHCAGSPARSVQEAAELRDRAFSLLPASLVGPWRSCRNFYLSPFADENGGLRCLLLGSFDLTGEDETVQFEATNGAVEILYLGTRFKKDLEVRGVDCGGERWRAGTWLPSGGSRLLRCQRQGRSAVSFRLVTGLGQCEGRLPELTEPPWQELCVTP